MPKRWVKYQVVFMFKCLFSVNIHFDTLVRINRRHYAQEVGKILKKFLIF